MNTVDIRGTNYDLSLSNIRLERIPNVGEYFVDTYGGEYRVTKIVWKSYTGQAGLTVSPEVWVTPAYLGRE